MECGFSLYRLKLQRLSLKFFNSASILGGMSALGGRSLSVLSVSLSLFVSVHLIFIAIRQHMLPMFTVHMTPERFIYSKS